ncbi:MAG: archaemetzincin [Planctomycetia bacterium]|nr:archaemetzincin [Planctomycetia bacterium]
MRLALMFLGMALALLSASGSERPMRRTATNVGRDPKSWYSPALFKKMGKPKPGEWLDRFDESGQTFTRYARTGPPGLTKKRKAIVIIPLGPFSKEQKKMLEDLREFTSLYFNVPVRLAKGVAMPEGHSRRRARSGRQRTQYQTGHILNKILKPRLPKDAVCLLGVTMQDLYPDEKWNYVFGQASLRQRVGVYSLVRYFPEFWGEKQTKAAQVRAFSRACKTLAHETGHMFGIQHCIAYECLMNGSNSLAESDSRPTALCPVCLKKLRWNLGFNVVKRYRKLAAFYKKHKLKSEAGFIEKRLKEIGPKEKKEVTRKK